MAQLAHNAVADIRQAIRDGRPAVVVGPARSGLTWLVGQVTSVGLEPISRLGLRNVHDIDKLRAAVRESLGLLKSLERPSDLQIALGDMAFGSRPRLVVVNDCHRAKPELLSWLLEAALEPVAGGAKLAVPFVFEGAFDPDLALAHAFPAGYATQPLIHYVEPASPWRVLMEVDEIMRGRWRQSFSPGLVPLIADGSGGDVSLVVETLARLPNGGDIRDGTLEAAHRHVASNGVRAREIRESVDSLGDRALLKRVASGAVLPGVVPPALEDCQLKRAYFAGLVEFDGIAGAYRVRGSLTAKIVHEHLGVDGDNSTAESRNILSRLLIFFAHIAAFELDLRSALQSRDPLGVAAGISAETGLGQYQKKVRDLVVRIVSPSSQTLGELSQGLKAILPESQALTDQIADRLGKPPTEESVLEYVTFSQLALMARRK